MKRNTIKLVSTLLVVVSLLAIPLMGACAPEEEVEPVVLGLPTSLGYWFGVGALEGATLAVEEINDAGGVNVAGEMRPIELVSIDTRDSAPGVPTADSLLAIEKLILDESPHAIVCGPNRSEVMLSAMDTFAEYNMICIDCLAKSPAHQAKIAEDPETYKHWFRITTNAYYMADYHVQLIAQLGDEFGFNKVFPILQDVLWATGTAALTMAGLEELGWEVVGSETVPLGTTDFSIPLLKAKEAGAQVIPMFFDMPEVAHLIDQWATMEIPAMAVGVIGPLLDPTAWEAYDQKVEGVILHICEAGVFPVSAIPKSVAFWEAYVERWGHEPEGIAGQSPSYDAVYLIKDAIERAGTLDTDALVTALEEADYYGAVGRIRFDETHQAPYGFDPEETCIGVFVQWQQPGEKKLVFPLIVAEADFVLPPWMQ